MLMSSNDYHLHHRLEVLDYSAERELLMQVFREVHRDVAVHFDFATTDALRTALSLGEMQKLSCLFVLLIDTTLVGFADALSIYCLTRLQGAALLGSRHSQGPVLRGRSIGSASGPCASAEGPIGGGRAASPVRLRVGLLQ